MCVLSRPLQKIKINSIGKSTTFMIDNRKGLYRVSRSGKKGDMKHYRVCENKQRLLSEEEKDKSLLQGYEEVI